MNDGDHVRGHDDGRGDRDHGRDDDRVRLRER